MRQEARKAACSKGLGLGETHCAGDDAAHRVGYEGELPQGHHELRDVAVDLVRQVGSERLRARAPPSCLAAHLVARPLATRE